MKILNVDAFFETSTLIRLFAASNSWFKTLRTRMSKDLGDSIFSYNSDTNYDEATLRQQKDIEDEISATQPLIGSLEDLESLELEVSPDDVFLSKVQSLKRKYGHYRRVRGDGNCFYRAFGFACLEGLLKSKSDAEQLKTIIERSKDELVSLGYSECTVEDFQSMFLETIDAMVAGSSVEKLLDSMNDRTTSDYIVVYLRLLVSSYLQRNSEFFMNFIEGSKSIRDFCVQEVEPMNRESDQIHIIALTSYMNVGVRIEYIDRSEAMTHHDFPEGCTPRMFLLYRPGHYDILYE